MCIHHNAKVVRDDSIVPVMAVQLHALIVCGTVDAANKLIIVVDKGKYLHVSGFGDYMSVAAGFQTGTVGERHKRAKNGEGR